MTSMLTANYDHKQNQDFDPNNLTVVSVIYPEELGAVGDGHTDDTNALQRTLDLWTQNRNSPIYISADYNIVGTLRISNLETDDPETRIKFVGGGTLRKMNPGYMFDRPAGQVLQTGHLFFEGIRFEGANLVGETYILNGENMIRSHLLSCFGTKINIAKSAGYLQTIYCDAATTWREWRGYLFDCLNLYDISWDGIAEAGDAFLRTTDAAADPACNSLKIRGNIEGLSGESGRAISIGVCWASNIGPSLYMEHNAGGDISCNEGIGFHKGLTIAGVGVQPTVAQLADPAYYPILTGKGAVDSLTLVGNSSTGNLFDVAVGNQSAVVSMGNYVPSNKNLFSATSSRLFLARGSDYLVSLLPGFGVLLMGYYSSLGFENTRTTVGGESTVAQITFGATNPQSSPGDYPQVNWVQGSVVINKNANVAERQYGIGITHDALIVGWQCVASGTPGLWREVAILLPF